MTTPPGWHPDPSGRHQHRFWDGSGWTDQVSDDGVTSTDPVEAPAATTTAFGDTGGSQAGAQEGAQPWATADASAPSGGKSKAPMFVGIAVVVALIAGGIFFLTNRDSGSSSSSGIGDHTVTVGTDELTTHTFEAKAGDFVFIGYEKADLVSGGIGLPRSAADEMVELDDTWSDTRELFVDSNELTASVFTDIVPDDADLEGELLSLPGFDGVLVSPMYNDYDGSPDRAAAVLISPMDTTFNIVLLSNEGEVEIDLNIRVESQDDVPDPLDEDALDRMYASQEMRDFRNRMAEEFGLSEGRDIRTDDFTDDFTTDDWTDDSTDWSDDFTDDWTDWTDDFSGDWTDWDDEWSDLDSQFSDLMTELDNQLSD